MLVTGAVVSSSGVVRRECVDGAGVRRRLARAYSGDRPEFREVRAGFLVVLSWVLQGLMAALFLVHGALMVAPPERIMRRMREAGRAASMTRWLLIQVNCECELPSVA